jgi:hypothetical protein
MSPSANLQVGHDSWTFKEGAPENVIALAQTNDGFLWRGNETGRGRDENASKTAFAISALATVLRRLGIADATRKLTGCEFLIFGS